MTIEEGPFDRFVREERADIAAAPERAPGFYWVRYGREWTVAEYMEREFWPCGCDSPFDDRASLKVIGPLPAPGDGND